ncbi:MAG: lysozyme [Undibacterium sp.]
MSRMKKSATFAALAVGLVGAFEGLRTAAYRDPVGIPTVCFGETRGVKMGQKYTSAECKAMFIPRLAEFENGMVVCLKNSEKIPDGAYAAFLSFSYNVGTGAFCKSGLVAKANAGDLRGACNELPKWNKARGIKLPGLTNRRAAEQKLCLNSLK